MTKNKNRQTKRAEKPRERSPKYDRTAIEAWQIDHIRESIRQADAGEFASDEEIAAVFAPCQALE